MSGPSPGLQESAHEPCGQLPGEHQKAFGFYRIYRDMQPGKRSLAAVIEQLPGCRDHTRKARQIIKWHAKFSWPQRANTYDALLDAAAELRKDADAHKLATQHAGQLALVSESLMCVVQAAAIAFKDPTRVAEVNAMSTRDILLLGLQASAILAPIQQAERSAQQAGGQNV
jgi:hypothetical protein